MRYEIGYPFPTGLKGAGAVGHAAPADLDEILGVGGDG